MAKFDFENYEKQQTQKTEKQDYAKVGYFNSLKNDGDEAIVRFNYTNASEFDLLAAHNEKVGDNYRYISCLRSATEPIEKCPLCQRGDAVTLRFFVKLIEYVKDENGNIVPVAKIWNRPVNFARQLKAYIDEYGNLKDLIFKVKRHGEKGSLQTNYDIIPANRAVYKENIYVKDFSAFDTLDLAHHSYYDLNYDEVNYYITTGEIPAREKVEQKEEVQQQAPAQTTQTQAPVTEQQPVNNNGRRVYTY